MAKKWVYLFSEGDAGMRNLLGGKGANLAEMTNLGLPVPQGFTITTEACTQYYEDGKQINDEIQGQIMEYIIKMEEITGKKFGDKENPLLVSVRSGARASMPGMMDTILNLGLNEDVVNVLAEKSGNPRWAWDCYRRFKQLGEDLYRLSRADEGVDIVVDSIVKKSYISLLSTFRPLSLEYRKNGYNQFHAWQSWSSIRNTEILFDLNQYLQTKCKKAESNRLYMVKYFETLSKFSIRTYDRDAKDTFYNINFEYASLIAELLNDVSIEDKFNEIFNDDVLDNSEDDSVCTIDVDKVLKGRQAERNKKATVLKYLMDLLHLF